MDIFPQRNYSSGDNASSPVSCARWNLPMLMVNIHVQLQIVRRLFYWRLFFRKIFLHNILLKYCIYPLRPMSWKCWLNIQHILNYFFNPFLNGKTILSQSHLLTNLTVYIWWSLPYWKMSCGRFVSEILWDIWIRLPDIFYELQDIIQNQYLNNGSNLSKNEQDTL